MVYAGSVENAPCTSGSELPNWEEPVGRLFKAKLNDGFESFRTAGFSLPSIIEFIKIKLARSSVDENFLEAVREALYKTFPCRDASKIYEREAATKIVEHVESANKTLA